MRTDLIFNPADAAFHQDRYPAYRQLRDSAPALMTTIDDVDCCVVTRYADVDAILRDERARVQPEPGVVPARIGTGPASVFYRNSLPCMDPPDHTRLRKLIMPAFTARTVAPMREWITQIVDDRLDAVADLGTDAEFDFVEHVAGVIPAAIACRFVHADESDAGELLTRQMDLNPVLSASEITPEKLAAADDAAQFYFDYFGDVVDTLRGKLPPNDLLGVLLQAEEAGDRLSRVELITALTGLLIASYHTTRVSLTAAMNALLTHPQQAAALRADPTLALGAWEETLRWDAPIHFVWRDLIAPMDIAGQEVAAGTHVVLGLAAANRDERRFPDADHFDPARQDRRHLAFASGAHYCPGAPLSRLEGEIFLNRFTARFPHAQLAVAQSDLVRHQDLTFTFIEQLPMRAGIAA